MRPQRRREDTPPYHADHIPCFTHSQTGVTNDTLIMSLPVRKRLPHEVPQWVREGSYFLITIKCRERGRNQLCRVGAGDALLKAAVFYHERLYWHCRLMLLMPDHLHGIFAFPREPGLKTTVSNWKKYLAREQGVQWQRDFFDHRLRDHQEVGEKTSYVRMNPVRRGLCERAEDWPWVCCPSDRLPPSW